MPQSAPDSRTLFGQAAIRKALRVGLDVNGLLLRHASQIAAAQAAPGAEALVTIEHVEAAIAACLPDDLQREIGLAQHAARAAKSLQIGLPSGRASA